MPTKTRMKPKSRPKGYASHPSAVTLPKWPLLQPSLPVEALSLETLLENQIIVIRDFFSFNLCKNYVSFLSTLPLLTTPAKPKDGNALRVNDRIEFSDFDFAQQLWNVTGLSTLLRGSPEAHDHRGRAARDLWGGTICGLNPRIRIYRYREGQFFAQHYCQESLPQEHTTATGPALSSRLRLSVKNYISKMVIELQ
ncbi:uncharacterized protein KY384_006055 [Bacidia gigantensis]|uniref:uncharacterized protein n=1 Tax=Bacidia gigantensis TaxID=2732470 RepID=UPI001D03E673|nr:uncharacterized protein KY384_006055 [Bacidia gigantensis]KAG8529418.1 hypothetical protein KY384_006055 [Bacidia gigantensis]